MSPALPADSAEWTRLVRIARGGPKRVVFVKKAHDQAIALGVLRLAPAQDWIVAHILARRRLNRTEWKGDSEYGHQINYEIRATFEAHDVYVKLHIAQTASGATLAPPDVELEIDEFLCVTSFTSPRR